MKAENSVPPPIDPPPGLEGPPRLGRKFYRRGFYYTVVFLVVNFLIVVSPEFAFGIIATVSTILMITWLVYSVLKGWFDEKEPEA